MATLESVIQDWHNSQPHPKSSDITVGDYPIAARLATLLKFGQGHASPLEVSGFWKEFQNMNQKLQSQNKEPISPEEFTHLTQQMAKVSFAYHGRPPSMQEVTRLRDAHPKDIRDYYYHLPDEHYPDVTAGDMTKYIALADPHAREHIDRAPTKLEARVFAHGNVSPAAIADYYKSQNSQHQSQQQLQQQRING